MKLKNSPVLAAVKICCRVLDEKKAEDLKVLDVSEQSSITDYLIVATATSLPHLRALRVELEKALDAANTHLVGMEATEESGWLVIDAFYVMIHLFLAEPREKYGLERLWRDAMDISVKQLLAKEADPGPKRKAAVGKKSGGRSKKSTR
jgi:ribosome-associated protein